jgi:hypothetical protein
VRDSEYDGDARGTTAGVEGLIDPSHFSFVVDGDYVWRITIRGNRRDVGEGPVIAAAVVRTPGL